MTATASSQRATGSEAVDWALAGRVGRQFAGGDIGPQRTRVLERLQDDFAEVSGEAEAIVAEYTGLDAPGEATVAVLDRLAWVDANVASMQRLLEPLTDRVGERMARSPVAPIGRRVAGAELGVLLGVVAQRVLGQYDLLVLEKTDTAADAVYYVGPNVLKLEAQYSFRSRPFRKWIAIHELTHRAQFTAVPWMRSHFLGLVEQSLALVDADPRRWLAGLSRIADDLRHRRNPLDQGGLFAIIATPEQRALLGEIQALMSLLEGHGNAVMNRAGREHVEDHRRMADLLEARRRAGGLAGFVNKLLGLEMKLRQYEVGERFVLEVEERAGFRALDAAWDAPENLPTLAELDDPDAWLARVGV